MVSKTPEHCEICGIRIKSHMVCRLCGSFVCEECMNTEEKLCDVCVESKCSICGEFLSSRACNLCGALVCEDHGIKKNEATICNRCQAI